MDLITDQFGGVPFNHILAVDLAMVSWELPVLVGSGSQLVNKPHDLANDCQATAHARFLSNS